MEDGIFEIIIPAVVKLPGVKTEKGKDGAEDTVTSIEIEYLYETFADEFIFNNTEWATEEWAGAYDRCCDLFVGATPGAVVRISDKDKAKVGSSLSKSVELWCSPRGGMDPKVRKRLMRYAHPVSTAKKAKDSA
jgi:hypothetical protein